MFYFANFILLIYLGAGFSNGKGLGELLSPFNLYGLIFWLYIGFLVVLWFMLPNQKQCQEIKEKLEKEEGEFKVLCMKNYERARRIAGQWVYKDATNKAYLYHQWFEEIREQDKVLRSWCVEIEQSKKGIVEYRKRINAADSWIRSRKLIGKGEDDEKIKECREVIKKNENYIKIAEANIEKYTEKLKRFGWDEHRQPIPPRTWDDVYEHIREYKSLF